MYSIGVFISHSWTYSGHYDKLREWIFGAPWEVNGYKLQFQDCSIPKDHPIHNAPTAKALENAIRQRIQLSHVVIIPTGMYVNYSYWINKEIKGAKAMSKPILGVDPWGQQRRSTVVATASSNVVGWTQKSVIRGIWDQYMRGFF